MRGTVVKRLRKEAAVLRNKIIANGGRLDRIPGIKRLHKMLKKQYNARVR